MYKFIAMAVQVKEYLYSWKARQRHIQGQVGKSVSLANAGIRLHDSFNFQKLSPSFLFLFHLHLGHRNINDQYHHWLYLQFSFQAWDMPHLEICAVWTVVSIMTGCHFSEQLLAQKCLPLLGSCASKWSVFPAYCCILPDIILLLRCRFPCQDFKH